MRPIIYILSLLSIISFSGCVTTVRPENRVTLGKAMEASINALNYAQEHTPKSHYGLLPKEVTLTYTLSDEEQRVNKASLSESPEIQGMSAITLSNEFTHSETTTSGNTIVMKFTRHGE